MRWDRARAPPLALSRSARTLCCKLAPFQKTCLACAASLSHTAPMRQAAAAVAAAAAAAYWFVLCLNFFQFFCCVQSRRRSAVSPSRVCVFHLITVLVCVCFCVHYPSLISARHANSLLHTFWRQVPFYNKY